MRVTVLSVAILLLFGVVVIAQTGGETVHLPVIASGSGEMSVPASLRKGYVKDCETTHRSTQVRLVEVNYTYHQLVYSNAPDGPPLGGSDQGILRISSTGPIEGDWWVWLVDANGNPLSEAVSVHTHGEPGLGNCQQADVVFYSEGSSPVDPCEDIGGDGCKFKVTGGPNFSNNGGAELKLQLFFINSAVEGGQPQGSYFIALEKNDQPLPISDAIRSIAHQRLEGPLGPYNYEYTIPLDALPDGQVDGNYVGWVLDGNGVRDSQNFSFTIPPNQGQVWVQFDQAGRGQYFNIAVVGRCDPNAGVTYVQGKTYVNGQPQSGYWVTFSYAPDGPLVAKVLSGPHEGYEGWDAGFYSHILQADGPREGDWWFWVVDSNDKRISEMAYIHTDGVAEAGKCQQAIIDFDSR